MANWHWAEGPEGRELRSGNVPSRDGSDYDESISPPRVNDIIKQMRTIEENSGKAVQKFIIIAIGKLGSEGSVISGIASKPIGWRDLRNLMSRGPFSYYDYMQNLFDASTPFKHIACVIIRPL